MTIIQQPATLLQFIYKQKAKDLVVGFVPTMGALHEGHIDLVKTAASQSDIIVCSIFVNPTQFNDPGDFRKYPNRLENDIKMLAEAGTDILFHPPAGAIYPNGTRNLESYDLGYLETILEGKYRPGHFQGVCQVMARLLSAVNPDKLFMGQKDYQQCMVVKQLLAIMGTGYRPVNYLEQVAVSEQPGLPEQVVLPEQTALPKQTSLPEQPALPEQAVLRNFQPVNNTELITCPTVRESDGLAMSSRNLRLNKEERQRAPEIYQTLQWIRKNIKPGSIELLKKESIFQLEKMGFKPDYVEIADASTLKPVSNWDGQQKLVALIAAFNGEIRLIDNIVM